MTRARELADLVSMPTTYAWLEARGLLRKLANIEEATADVGLIERMISSIRAFPYEPACPELVTDIETLLAIVKRQAGRIDSLEESLRHNGEVHELYRDACTLQQERDAARAEVARLAGELGALGAAAPKALPIVKAAMAWAKCDCGLCKNATYRECPALFDLATVLP